MSATLGLTNSAAASAGFGIGVLLGIGILIGLGIFTVMAIVKAFARKTAPWIIAATISGILLALFNLLFIVGLISGFASHKRASQNNPDQPKETFARVAALFDPNSGSKEVRGGDLAYTLSIPSNWTFKRREQDFDILASQSSLYVGVIAEEASLDTPENIATVARDTLKEIGTDVRWSEPSALSLDGRSWLEFVVSCKVTNIPFKYHFFVYAGPEGTFQVIGFTTQQLYDRDEERMLKVMKTFRFPPSNNASSPAPSGDRAN